LLGPADFLVDMEDAGLVVPLGHWIIDEVSRQIALWRSSYQGDLNVSINLSNREFVDGGLIPHIRECMDRHALAPSNLTVEVTESTITRNPEGAQSTIAGLQAIGVTVQIDNVGTSKSSLHALRSLPVQALKIDRSFIRELTVDPRARNLFEIIIAMGHAIGVDVIAEGVETAAQLALLREMGCRSAQGFWFTEPVNAADAAAMLGRTLPI
jgi:EAL domain-containing protein (putative c-di-GMP-specific phosphodiesterase class I)